MKRIEEIVDTFCVSKPIFPLKMNGAYIVFNISDSLNKWTPPVKENDPLYTLTCFHRYERFNQFTKSFTFDKDETVRLVMNDIHQKIINFWQKYSGKKVFNRCKVNKFLQRLGAYNEYKMPSDLAIALFLYIESWAHKPNNEQHIKNTLAIIEAAREKYDAP